MTSREQYWSWYDLPAHVQKRQDNCQRASAIAVIASQFISLLPLDRTNRLDGWMLNVAFGSRAVIPAQSLECLLLSRKQTFRLVLANFRYRLGAEAAGIPAGHNQSSHWASSISL